jgi:glycyl-tRNA synthetase
MAESTPPTPAPTPSPTPAPAKPISNATLMEKIVSLCKRKGFIFGASEIYGGINGFWDYGPLGVLLKNNIRDSWWRAMVECPPIGPDGDPVSMVGLDSSIIQNPKAWVASGHVGGFSDPMVDDRETKQRYRADHVSVFVPKDGKGHAFAFMPEDRETAEKKIKRDAKRNPDDYDITPLTKLPLDQYGNIVAPATKTAGTLTEPRAFNLMFVTYVGALQSDDAKAYLRPETAQGIFLNYKNIVDTTRIKMPFGVAQVGKSFRNEVTPRNFIFRSREFEQMEMEWFCHPDDARKWYDFWKVERMKWWRSLGVSSDKLIFRDHEQDELSHYSKMTVDIEYKYPFTDPDFGELEGIAHRGCFDLTQHQQHSGQKLDYFDQELQLRLKAEGVPDDEVKARSRYIPNVIEPASGLTRAVLVVLCEGYIEDPSRPSGVYLKFQPHIAPVKAGIFPLVDKEGMPEIAKKLYMDLRGEFMCEYDPKQAIGKRYARMDEIGTPYCFTIDGQTKEDGTVTVRDRDTTAQSRIPIDGVKAFLREKIG